MKWLLSILGVSAVGAVLVLLGMGLRDGRGRTTGAVELQRPPAAVFPFLVQPPLRKQWLLEVEEISPQGDPTLRAGARARVVMDAPERMEVEEEIRLVEADKRLLLQRSSSHPPFSQRLEYVLKDLGGGRTLLTVAIHTSYQGPVLNLLEPLLTRDAQAQLDQEIAQLRSAAESGAPPVAALPVVSAPPTPAVAPPPPPPAPKAPIRPGGEIQSPALVKRVDPVYPEIAVAANLEGIVILEAVVGTDGRVESVSVLRGIPLLDNAAKAAVMQWQYAPL
ncbi:MAG TPA: TonB family protein, partial [Myxococcales bacterium]|nr:TonB family protein [Myxococcales bacterium]